MGLFKKILNTPIADLRRYDENALSKLKMINAATIILPEKPTSEFLQAYSSINVNCAKTLYTDENTNIIFDNGIAYYDDNNVDPDVIYFVSGITVIDTAEKTPNVITNGIVITNKDAKINNLATNGLNIKSNIKFESSKLYNSKLVIENDYLENLPENVLIVSTGVLKFESNVDYNLLKNKTIEFVSTADIIAPKELISIVEIKSHTTGRFKTNG